MSRKVAVKSPKMDRRKRRTRDALGDALIALIQEKPFDSITVQEVLDRAKVGRSTFYLHYKDKDDLFLSDVEEFLELFATALSRAKDKSARLAPVTEFFTHVKEGRKLYRALVDAGKLDDFLNLTRGHFARGIRRRMEEVPACKVPRARRDAVSQGLAAALTGLLIWWVERGFKESPKEIEEIFQGMARNA